jgi:hypothetical protein
MASSGVAPLASPAAPGLAEEAGKLGQRVAEYLKTYREHDSPFELKPHQVGVHPANRGGADPNIQVLHHKVLASFAKDGYDPSRHLAPIVVRCSSEQAKANLQAHNRRFADGRTGFPSVDEKHMEFGSLAGSHLTLAFRCVEKDVFCLATGSGSKAIAEKQPSLKIAAERGLRYWILRENTPLSVLSDISQWRNQDQNSNQTFHDMELMVLIAKIARSSIEAAPGGKVNITYINSAVCRAAPVKLATRSVQGLIRYALQFFSEGKAYLLSDLTRWHSANIDPQEISVPSILFETLGNVTKYPSLKDAPLIRLYVGQAVYTNENAKARQRPTPDEATLFSSMEVDVFLRKACGP